MQKHDDRHVVRPVKSAAAVGGGLNNGRATRLPHHLPRQGGRHIKVFLADVDQRDRGRLGQLGPREDVRQERLGKARAAGANDRDFWHLVYPILTPVRLETEQSGYQAGRFLSCSLVMIEGEN